MTADTSPQIDPSLRRVGRDTLLYGLGQVATRVASLLMLPVYTRLLTPDDYGLLQLLDMTVDVVAILVSAGTTAGVMRFYFKATSDVERRRLLASAWVLQVGLNALGSALLIAAATPIWRQFLDGRYDPSLVYLAAVNFTLAAAFHVPLLVMQLHGRAALLVAATLARLALQLGLNLVLLIGFAQGPRGILLSNLVATLLVGGAASTWMFRRCGWRLSRAAMRDLRRFGLPYQLATAGTFILTFGDRVFLERFRDLAEVGLYSLAYSFGFLLIGVTYGPYFTAWTPVRHAQAALPTAERDGLYNRGLHFMSLLTIGGAAGLALFAPAVLRVMSSPAFHSAAALVPLVLVATIFQAWSDVARFNIDMSEQTLHATRATWIATVLILVLYAALIPPFGAVGAAAATAIAFLARFLLFARAAARLWPVDYDWGPSVRLLAAMAALTALHQTFAPADALGDIAAGALAFAVFAAIGWRGLASADRTEALAEVRRRGVSLRGHFPWTRDER